MPKSRSMPTHLCWDKTKSTIEKSNSCSVKIKKEWEPPNFDNFPLTSLWHIASSSACLRGDTWACCEYTVTAVGIRILKCEQPTALQTMICFSRAEQLHDASLSFTFSAYSCQLTQQHEATKSVRDLLQLCRLLQWWHYKGLHRQYQERKNMELTSHETASWGWPQTSIFDHNISYSPMAMRPKQTNSLSKAP